MHSDPSVIAALPSEWDVPSESAAHPLEAKRYAELAGELRALAERKQQALARVARLRRMKELLEPFSPSTSLTLTAAAADGDGEVVGDQGGDSSGGGAGVQENLVTRNGEIEAELQRMRVLLARVGGRVGLLREKRQQQQGDASQGGLGTGDGGETAMEVDDVDMDVQKKVGQLLESF
ncbi:hypothetical protein N656DRAFT_610435 [Canariomyces notabilis]|uniref:Kinetochore protein n=1 Tax=Canariomyces notabilis TaxID=2074819 RepID=A0AAN6YUZ5_9PEZI|nr:hypothetical protein N656DRAFT_610435 [Canariomyces arenarius]